MAKLAENRPCAGGGDACRLRNPGRTARVPANLPPSSQLLLGILAGLALLRREVLRGAGPWLAGAMTVALAAPNVLWDAAHGWPNLRMARSLAAEQGGPLGSLAHLPLLVLLAGPPMLVVWVSGIRWLASPAGRAHRWVLVVAGVAVVVFTASGGKAYYPAPVVAGLFAAGAVRLESTEWVRDPARAWRAMARPIGVSVLVALLVGLPVLPVSAANAVRVLNPTCSRPTGGRDSWTRCGRPPPRSHPEPRLHQQLR